MDEDENGQLELFRQDLLRNASCPSELDLIFFKRLISGERSYKEFTKEVSLYNTSSVCGVVWSTDFIAYRCRTCGRSPCMSLCPDCFEPEKHQGHDFNMFKSHAGGACDCGNADVMMSEGFCSRHSKDKLKDTPQPPESLFHHAKFLIPPFLVKTLRSLWNDDSNSAAYIETLQELLNMGLHLQQIVSDNLLSQSLYEQFFNDDSDQLKNQQEVLKTCQAIVNSHDHFTELQSLEGLMHKGCIFESMFMWCVEKWFPQQMVTFFLSLLSVGEFKWKFMKTFAQNYVYIIRALTTSHGDVMAISNAITQISVQLLSSLNFAYDLVNEFKLLHILLTSLYYILVKFFLDPGTQGPIKFSRSMRTKEHIYWPVTSDLINLLSHQPITHYFFSNLPCLNLWIDIVALLQGMNINKRERTVHLEFEPDICYPPYNAELEVCSMPVWNVLEHLKDPSTHHLTTNLLPITLHKLTSWLERTSKISDDELTFHLPLHRTLALFVSNALHHQQLPTQHLIFPQQFLHHLIQHPLKIMVGYTEVMSGMWVRNGRQMKEQAMLYTYSSFSSSTLDPDYFLLQLAASQMDPDKFVQMVLNRFHVLECLGMTSHLSISPEHHTNLVEGCLCFIATLLASRVLSGQSEEGLIRGELINLLCMGDKTHSQLMSSIPDRCSSLNSKWLANIDACLSEIAEFRPPVFGSGVVPQQGKYLPNGNVWRNEYDPLLVRMRALHKKDYQSSLDRFTEFVKREELFKKSTSLWPPFRIPSPPHPFLAPLFNILHCPSMHAFIFVLLYKCLHENLSDSILHLTIHLLELTIVFSAPTKCHSEHLKGASKEAGNKIFSSAPPSSSSHRSTSPTHPTPQAPLSPPTKSSPQPQPSTSFSFFSSIHPPSKSSSQPLSSSASSPSRQLSSSPSQPQQLSSLPQSSSSLGHYDKALKIHSNDIFTNVLVAMDDVWAVLGTDDARFPAKREGFFRIITTSSKRLRDRLFRSRHSNQSTTTTTTTTTTNTTTIHSPITTTISIHIDSATSTNNQPTTTTTQVSNTPNHLATTTTTNHSIPLLTTNDTDIGLDTPQDTSATTLDGNNSSNGESADDGVVTTIEQTLPTVVSATQHHYTPSLHHHTPSLHHHPSSPSTKTSALQPAYPENVLSLLLQLYNKFSKGPYKPPPIREDGVAEGAGEECRIGDAELFIGRVLDALVGGSEVVRAEVKQRVGVVDGTKSRDVLQLQKQKARDRQQKMLKEFQCKQKQFMQKSFQDDDLNDDEDDDNEDEEGEGGLCEEGVVKCCICAKTAIPSPPNPACLIALAIKTNLMGHRISSMQAALPPSTEHANSFSSHHERLQHLNKTAFKTSTAPWFHSLHVQTCGHHVHFNCCEAYIKTVQNQQNRLSSPQLLFEREFWCPVCRQISNTILPLSIPYPKDRSPLHPTHNHSPTDHHFIVSLLKGAEKASLSAELMVVDNSLVTISHSSTNDCTFYVNLFRNNIEIFLMGKRLSSLQSNIQSVKPLKKITLSVLYRICSSFVRTYSSEEVVKKVEMLAGTDDSFQDNSVCLAVMDIRQLFLTVLLFIPSLSPVVLSSMIRYFYNLYFLQLLAWMVSGGGEVDVRWWLEKEKLFRVELGAVVEVMLEELKDVPRSQQDRAEGTHANILISRLTDFLKFCAVVYSSVLYASDHMIENVDSMNLRELLGLVGVCEGDLPSSHTAILKCYGWSDEMVRMYAFKCCSHIKQLLRLDHSYRRVQEMLEVDWQPPRLMSLPGEYDALFMHFRKLAKVDENPLNSPSVCLVCSKLFTGPKNELHEQITHSQECGRGTGIFLLINSSMVVIVWGSRLMVWGSVYLDSHGEEDRDLKRGKPLYLNTERYNLLQHMWLTNSFDQFCKHWTVYL